MSIQPNYKDLLPDLVNAACAMVRAHMDNDTMLPALNDVAEQYPNLTDEQLTCLWLGVNAKEVEDTVMQAEDKMQDKNGNVIKAGDTLFNPYDRDKYYTVLQDEEGRLFLGDFDSPLERYAPQTWWEVVHDTK